MSDEQAADRVKALVDVEGLYQRLRYQALWAQPRGELSLLLTEAADALTALQARVGELEGAWDWLSASENLSLEYDYLDERDRGEWKVHRVSGSVNDREWQLVGSGETALEAVREARALLTPPLEQK